MFDYIAGFNPDEVRQPTTERELRVAAAAKLAGIDAYNFFENDGKVTYNVRKPAEDGGVWVSIHSWDINIIDHVSDVALSVMMSKEPELDNNLKAEG